MISELKENILFLLKKKIEIVQTEKLILKNNEESLNDQQDRSSRLTDVQLESHKRREIRGQKTNTGRDNGHIFSFSNLQQTRDPKKVNKPQAGKI